MDINFILYLNFINVRQFIKKFIYYSTIYNLLKP